MEYICLYNEILNLSKELTYDKLEEIDRLLESYIEKDAYNTDLLLRISVLQLCPPLMDTERCIYYLLRILAYDKENLFALLILSYVENEMLGGMSDDLFNILCNLKMDDEEEQSLVYYCLAGYYYYRDDCEKFEEMITLAIKTYPYHVKSYVSLGKFYIRNKNMVIGKDLIRTALANIRLVYSNVSEIDVTDYKEFINENIKGVHITEVNLEGLKERLI